MELTMTEARARIGPLTSQAEFGGQTVYLTKNGRRAAAIVPASAAQLLEEMENLVDVEEVGKVLERLDDGTETRRRIA
jgi:prevent-host-death family protein